MIHLFDFDGTKIVLDVNSGTVHVFDEVAWSLLKDYGRLTEKELIEKHGGQWGADSVLEALGEIQKLKQEGRLYSPDPYQEKRNAKGGSITKALCLHLAHSCNLRCRYCFAGQGRFGGADELMSAETGCRAIDFLIRRSGGRKRLEIDFFGGEPLLNLKVLQELVEYGKKRGGEEDKEIKFTVTTNAVLLDENVSRYLIDNGISVVLSLDGRREIHDRMRPFPGGGGSFETVLPRIKNFLDMRERSYHLIDGTYAYIRGTYTRYNLDFGADVVNLANLGFKRISMEPVVAPADADYSIREEDLPFLFSQYEQLAREMLLRRKKGNEIDFFHFNIDLEGGPCLQKRLSGCGAGHEYMAVAPNGDLYPCHQFVGRDRYLMGNVLEGVVDEDLAASFRSAHVYNKERCPECWAKFYCGGGCHANAETFNGSIFKPYGYGCALVKKRLECAIYLKVMEKLL